MLLTFHFEPVEEAQEFLAGLGARETNPTATEVTALLKEAVKAGPGGETLLAPVVDAAVASIKKNAEKKKRGPKPKEKAEPAKEYGMEDSRFAFSGLFDIKGRDAAKAVLAEFKVARVSELKPDQHRDFIVRCGIASLPE